MTMTIIATYEVRDIDEFHELIASLRELEPIKLGCVGTAYAPNIERVGEMDLTPAHGIERVSAFMSRAVDQYTAALVMWTREHITEGPLVSVPDEVLTACYRELQTYGVDTDIAHDNAINSVEAMCIRGAFRDATAGMVPL